jgi:hypothetical protein
MRPFDSLRIAGRIGLLALALAGCQDWFSSGTPQPPASDYSPTTTAKPIVDTDYHFRLSPPGGEWRLMGESEIRKMVPDALAGAIHPQGMFGVVVVEPAPGVAADELAAVVAENMDLEDKQIGPFEPLDYAGKPATRFSVTGTTEGLRFRYVNHVFLHQGYFYQVMGGGMAARVDEQGRALEPFFASFSLQDGEVRGRKATHKQVDSAGVGWRLRQGVFESAAYGIRVEAQGDFHLAVGAELQQMNSNAEIGLSSEHAYLILLLERASGVDKKSFEQRLRTDMLHNMNAQQTGAPVVAQLDGRQVRLVRMRTTTKPTFEYLHGVLFEGDLAIQILYWSLASLSEKATQTLPQALASIRFLDEPAVRALAAQLHALPDPQNKVGPGFALRRGVWRDFEHGLTWQKPTKLADPHQGFWRVSAGEQARAFNPDASLVIEDPVSGLFGMLIVESAGDMTAQDYHELVTGRVFADRSTARTSPLELGAALAQSTIGRKTEAGLELSYQMVTTVHTGLAVQFAFWGVPQAMQENAAVISKALAGLSFHKRLLRTEALADRYVDHRFGFSYRPISPAWTRTDLTPAELREIGTVLSFQREKAHLLMVSICALDAGQDEEWFLRFIEETMRRKMAGLPLGAPQRDQIALAGETWERLRWRGGFEADAHLVMRDKTFYALMSFTDKRGASVPAGAERGFAFLD